MARLGLQARDTLSLSFTKFKIRRIRTVLTLISTSVLALVLVAASSVLTGFMRAADATPQSQLVNLHLAQAPVPYDPTTSTTISEVTPSGPGVAADLQRAITALRGQVKDGASLKDVYVEVSPLYGSQIATLDILGGPPPSLPGDPSFGPDAFANGFVYRGVTGKSTELLKPFIDGNQPLDAKAGDPLPVLVPTDAILRAHEGEFEKLKRPELRVAKRTEYQRALLGKVGQLTIENNLGPIPFPPDDPSAPAPEPPAPAPAKVFPVRVVGFLPVSSLFGAEESYSDYVFPYEAAARNAEAASFLNGVNALYPSFVSTQARNAFVSGNKDASIYADVVESNKEAFRPFTNAFRILVIVMLLLMAIPMAATMSKLLADSQRETGVFRAIGARNRNILAIYGLYATQMVLASFLLALVAGELFCLWLTSRVANNLELAAADYADTVVQVSFVQFNVPQLATILAGLLGGALVGAAIPLFRALRRDPIKSLRDE